jgi:hypothetical protein
LPGEANEELIRPKVYPMEQYSVTDLDSREKMERLVEFSQQAIGESGIHRRRHLSILASASRKFHGQR